ncbi:MAG: ABC transporter ATP-binding protein [Bacteroidetes bacterium]|nr:ABC transporter ATP-binding protein [Bacteroidota bacterium]
MNITLQNISYNYGNTEALKNVSLEIAKGEIISLIGPNGSGKSTLIKTINRILCPREGTVYINGTEQKRIKLRKLSKLVGYVGQSPNNKIPSSVFETVLLGRRPYVNWKLGEKDKTVVNELIARMNLDDIALKYVNELSGGEQQKVFITRALAQETEYLLIDEPTNNLDLKHQVEALDIIRSFVRERNIGAVIAIHDLNLAARYSDKAVLMKEGKIIETGKTEEILTKSNIRKIFETEVDVVNNDGILHFIPYV